MSAVSPSASTRTHWSAADRATAGRLYRDGHDMESIAASLGRTRGAVQTVLSIAGVRQRVETIPPAYRDSMREKAGAGWRPSRIARATGYDVETVERVVARYGAIRPIIDVRLDRPILVRIPRRPKPVPVVEVAPEPVTPPPPPPPAFPKGRGITMRAKRIIRLVSAATGVPIEAIFGRGKKTPVVAARCAVYYWLRREGYSLNTVGRMMGRDHTTVMYGADVYLRRRAERGRRLSPIVVAVAEPVR